ncbi:hypothetical protein AALP_AA1G042800 [Arabis alpina]|uniref:CCHC-type domain-containing protein n=1 Tax=Arabis alpina TaxID=50452 RepID=A0A087HL14_ARAAL|nr:hypothetical protein AALP_AA1G042800 [Arabis alpina]
MGKKKPPENPSPKSLVSPVPVFRLSHSPLGSDGLVANRDTNPPINTSALLGPSIAPLVLVSVPLETQLSTQICDPAIDSVKVDSSTDPETPDSTMETVIDLAAPVEITPTVKVVHTAVPVEQAKAQPLLTDSWSGLFKGSSKELQKKGTAFTLPSGEACVTIPNSVIENNRKGWECFILGQFYSDPPSQGIIHNIVNGIWSRQYRDVTVSKLEGHAFLFRVPNASTRHRVLTQRLWQIEGQTMFVAKWEPGMKAINPELTSAPIWLELRNVPLQFFHEEGLEHIAGLVGKPKALHPSTMNKTNLEVAKVFTIIDPRKPLPEAVNVQFESGDIARVLVSSPWMPPICSYCKEVGHILKRCKVAPIQCNKCSSTAHITEKCQKRFPINQNNGQSRRGRARSRSQGVQSKADTAVDTPNEAVGIDTSTLDKSKGPHLGESSGLSVVIKHTESGPASGSLCLAKESKVEEDSSDVDTNEDQTVSVESSDHQGYTKVSPKKKKKKKNKRERGKGPNSS